MSEHTKSDKADARLYFIHALSPLHAGTGEGLGAINLPTARERLTGYPYLPGTSLKGVLRAVAESRYPKDSGRVAREVCAAFGPDTENAADARGGVVFSDASLLALPVRSLFGTFAWVTCPYVIRRLLRDARETIADAPELAAFSSGLGEHQAYLPQGSKLCPSGSNQLFLLDLSVDESKVAVGAPASDAAQWIGERVWPGDADAQALFKERFVVIDDDVFGFLSRTATEIRSRVKIDDATGTAAASGSWTEEHLPAETLLHGVAIGRATQYFRQGRDGSSSESKSNSEPKVGEAITEATAIGVLDTLLSDGPTLRFGGKSSTGMGRARITLDGVRHD